MGLDMYIYKSKKGEEVAYWRKANAIHGFFEKECGGEYGLNNCQEVKIHKETLERLLNACVAVMRILSQACKIDQQVEAGFRTVDGELQPVYETIKVFDDDSVRKIMEILPPEEGFFFGSYEIGEWYQENIKDTIEICTKLLAETDFETEELRYHGWW